LALIWPAMVEAVEPVTRLSVALPASGWLKVTPCPAATSKLCQLMMALALDWLIDRVPPRGADLRLPRSDRAAHR
jgi:hypothetical protein